MLKKRLVSKSDKYFGVFLRSASFKSDIIVHIQPKIMRGKGNCFLNSESSAFFLLTFVLTLNNFAYANDGAADVRASGIQFRKEESISVGKEDLYISGDKIEVAYIFKNNSDQDITDVMDQERVSDAMTRNLNRRRRM
jgi:Domain of unknown function (DUF4424)